METLRIRQSSVEHQYNSDMRKQKPDPQVSNVTNE